MRSPYARATRAHPQVRVAEPDFVAAWRRLEPDERLAADVLLAVGIEQGDPAALRWLRSELRAVIEARLSRVPQHLFDEIESRTLELIAVGEKARIKAYAAKGPLAAWARVLVVRTAHAVVGPTRNSTEELTKLVSSELEAAGSTSPQLQLLVKRYRGPFGEGLAAAVLRLSSRDRSLLHLHYCQGVGLETLARTHQVHRATVSRWLAQARQALLDLIRAEMASRAHIPASELDSLARALGESLQISLKRLMESE